MLNRPSPTPIRRPTPTPPQDARYGLDVDAAERESLLAALEIAQALTDGDTEGAPFLATVAYRGPALSARLSTLADCVFRLGRPLVAGLPTLPALPGTEVRARVTV